MEMTFMDDMWQLMQASHFRLLSEDDWDTAQEEQFTVSSSKHVPAPQFSQLASCINPLQMQTQTSHEKCVHGPLAGAWDVGAVLQLDSFPISLWRSTRMLSIHLL